MKKRGAPRARPGPRYAGHRANRPPSPRAAELTPAQTARPGSRPISGRPAQASFRSLRPHRQAPGQDQRPSQTSIAARRIGGYRSGPPPHPGGNSPEQPRRLMAMPTWRELRPHALGGREADWQLRRPTHGQGAGADEAASRPHDRADDQQRQSQPWIVLAGRPDQRSCVQHTPTRPSDERCAPERGRVGAWAILSRAGVFATGGRVFRRPSGLLRSAARGPASGCASQRRPGPSATSSPPTGKNGKLEPELQ